MNIFYLDHQIDLCAQYHVDKHCVKMIVELAQILSTAHRILDGEKLIGISPAGRKQVQWRHPDAILQATLYKATHPNHPSAVWARATSGNYTYTKDLLVALGKEYTHRYGKIHKVFRTELGSLLEQTPSKISSASMTTPALAMPDDYKTSDPVESYRNYYNEGKRHLHSWKNRQAPCWIK